MADDAMPNRPMAKSTLVDHAFRVAYVCAYRGMRIYWKIAHPETQGTLVTLWNRGEVLLVRNSYVPYYSLPGGYIRRGEEPADAAIRELTEEIGVSAKAEDLALVFDRTQPWEGKRDHVRIFRLDVASRPEIRVDNREVIEASWWLPERALGLNLFPPVRTVLEERARGAPSHTP